MIRSSEIRDWAEAARLFGVTRARMTQIAHLLLLAPALQDLILSMATCYSGIPTERQLRPVISMAPWEEQMEAFHVVRREQPPAGMGGSV
jgi:hypothetical protein